MKRSSCPRCFLYQIIGPAAMVVDTVEMLVLLDAVKRYAGLEFEAVSDAIKRGLVR